MADDEATHLTRVRTEGGRRGAHKWDEQGRGGRYVFIDCRLSLHGSAKESVTELRRYGRRLLGTFHATELAELEADGGAWTTCREAVEILTRSPKKGK